MKSILRDSCGSLTELIDLASKPGKCAGGNDDAERLLHSPASAFYNHKTFADLRRELREGSPATLAAIASVKDLIETQIVSPTRKRRKMRHRLENGDEYSPDAWVNRDPNGWTAMQVERRPKSVMRIAVNTVTSFAQSSSVVLFRGAAAAAVADLMVAQGLNVEITAFCASARLCDAWPVHVLSTTVKPASAPLNLEAVAIMVAEIAFTRRVVYAAECRLAPTTPNMGLGSPISLPDEDRAGYDMVIDVNVSDLPTAVNAVLAQMERTQ